MFEPSHRIDQRTRFQQRRTVEIKVKQEERSKEAEELRMRGRHSVSCSQSIPRARLLDEPLECPIEAFAGQLPDQRIDKGKLATQQYDRHVRAQQEDGRERDERH